jgi:hypothetical protein
LDIKGCGDQLERGKSIETQKSELSNENKQSREYAKMKDSYQKLFNKLTKPRSESSTSNLDRQNSKEQKKDEETKNGEEIKPSKLKVDKP